MDTAELLFITDDFFAYLCQETNRYHDEQGYRYKILKHASKWSDVIKKLL